MFDAKISLILVQLSEVNFVYFGILSFRARCLLCSFSSSRRCHCSSDMVFRLSKRNFSIKHVIPIPQDSFTCGDEKSAVTFSQKRGKSLSFSLTEVDIQFSSDPVKVNKHIGSKGMAICRYIRPDCTTKQYVFKRKSPKTKTYEGLNKVVHTFSCCCGSLQ